MNDARVRGIVLAHGDMPQGLIDAVMRIAGVEGDFLVPLSNRGLGPDSLAEEINTLAAGSRAIIFTDLQSGSCGFAARRCLHSNPQLVVISGVNLPMLLAFALKRELPLEELVPLLMEKGRAAISCSPANFENHEHRAVSGG
jgi:mannose/fructose-specific phosphotransferase system component IIA